MSAAAGAGAGAPRFSFFLSHNWGDKPIVEELKRRLEQRPGVRCWIDTEQMAAGAWLFDAIQDGIDESAVFMAFVSEGYVASDNCNKDSEVHRAERVQRLVALAHATRRPTLPASIHRVQEFALATDWKKVSLRAARARTCAPRGG